MVSPHPCRFGTLKNAATADFARFNKHVLLGTILFLLPVVIPNFLADPLGVRPSHSPAQAPFRMVFNERQMKANHLVAQKPDAAWVLLGSSRCTYIPADDPVEGPGLNLALRAMHPLEYGPFLSFAERRQGRAFKKIVIGFDFFGVRQRDPQADVLSNFESPETYIQRAEDPLNLLKSMLGWHLWQTSMRALKFQWQGRVPKGIPYYSNGKLHRSITPLGPGDRMAELKNDLKVYRYLYTHKFKYNENFKNDLLKLKSDHASSEFLVFTTPEHPELFHLIQECGRSKDHQRWLQELISVFGTVMVFGGDSATTRAADAFLDGHHPSPALARLLLEKTLHPRRNGLPSGFGHALTNPLPSTWPPQITTIRAGHAL